MQVEAAFQLIRHAQARGRLAHAYLIAGPTRGAAGELALRIIQLLFCPAAEPPCGTCHTCQQARARTIADLFWLQPEKKSRVISAEAMREKMLAEIAQTSLAGGWKVGVIAGADRLNEASANIFLKTLEEPPPRTLFLLLTDAPQEIMPTIVSRCQRMELESSAELAEPWRARLLACLGAATPPGPLPAMGLAARLTELLDDLKKAAEDEVKAEVKAEAGTVEETDEVNKARISARYREMRTDLLRAMLWWYRDLLLLRAGGAGEQVHYRDFHILLKERAANLTLAQAMANVDGMEVLNRQLERSLPEETVFSFWLDRFSGGITPPAVAPPRGAPVGG
jgi:DNA polymerase-3 subunit delta'